jgi:uncharacterized protein YdiU (UPF0061 family)
MNGTARGAAMRRVNPLYIPRNHQIEKAIRAAVDGEDFGPFARLHQVLSRPYELQGDSEAYTLPPLPAERVLQMFCGT